MAKTTRSSGRAPAPHIPEDAAVSRSFIDEHGKSFDADPFNTVRQNAMAEADAGKLGLNQRVAMAVDRNFPRESAIGSRRTRRTRAGAGFSRRPISCASGS